MTLEGEITVFLRAVGAQIMSPEYVELLALAGPLMESQREHRGGAEWEYQTFPRNGVTLQFKDAVLVGALIPLVSIDGEPAYPSPDELISGLVLPASRAQVASVLGVARRSAQDLDLYLEGDRYLRFDFTEDRSTYLTVVLPGVEV